MAWYVLVDLLATEDPGAREVAYQAFRRLPEIEQDDMLELFLKVKRIEDWHPLPGAFPGSSQASI